MPYFSYMYLGLVTVEYLGGCVNGIAEQMGFERTLRVSWDGVPSRRGSKRRAGSFEGDRAGVKVTGMDVYELYKRVPGKSGTGFAKGHWISGIDLDLCI